MNVTAVQSNSDNGMLSTVMKTSTIGAGLGYVSKYMLPINEQERDGAYHDVVKAIRAQSKKIKEETIQDIKNIKNKTLAQDTFIKMIDNKENFDMKNINQKVSKLGGPEAVDAIEFKNIINSVNQSATKFTKQCVSVYNGYIKRIRPTAPFIVAGAMTGLFVGVAHNVLKTNTNA